MTEEIKQWISDQALKRLPINSAFDEYGTLIDTYAAYRNLWRQGAQAMYEKLTEQHRQEIQYWKQRLSNCEDINQREGREGEIDTEK